MNQFKGDDLPSQDAFISRVPVRRWHLHVFRTLCCGLVLCCLPHAVVGQEAQVNRNIAINFRVHLPEPLAAGESVFLSGNHPTLGNWKPAGLRLLADTEGHYLAKIEVPQSTNLQFKLTRGSWSTVETKSDGKDRPNRTLVVDQAKTEELIVDGWADQTRGSSNRSTVVGDLRVWVETSIEPSRSIRVWLPPSYGQLDDKGLPRRFPVLYMLDGQNLFDAATSAFGIEWEIDESLTRGIATGEVAEMIVVGIDNSAQRIEEYTHQKFELGGELRGGNADAFVGWLSKVLKKKIDQDFATMPSRESTWIGGSSLAGLCTLHAVLTRDNIFSKGLVFSPSVFWGSDQLIEDILSQIQKINAPVQLWIDFGDSEGKDTASAKENLDRFTKFQSAVSDASEAEKPVSTKVTFSIIPGGEHSEASWGKRFLVGLKAIVD